MASGVMEWTSSVEKDPARVKEPPGPVACGGDWRYPGITDKVEYLRSRDECPGQPGIQNRAARTVIHFQQTNTYTLQSR